MPRAARSLPKWSALQRRGRAPIGTPPGSTCSPTTSWRPISPRSSGRSRIRCLSTVCPSRSRTTSIWRVCRPRSHAPPSPIRRLAALQSCSGCWTPAPCRSARRISTSSRRGWWARARPGVRCTTPATRVHRRRIERGLGRCAGARSGGVRARHRHGGLGARAGRLQQRARTQTDTRLAQHARGRAGLPLARLRLGIRAHGVGSRRGAGRRRRLRPRRSLRASVAARRPHRRAAESASTSGCRAKATWPSTTSITRNAMRARARS